MEKINPEFYDEDYFENGISSNKSGYGGYNWSAIYPHIARGLVNNLKPNKILDIGCAKGFLIKELMELGVKAHGLEISEYAYNKSEPSVKPYITVGSITELKELYSYKIFDLVICYDILEHLTDSELRMALEGLAYVSSDWVTIKCPFQKYDWDNDKSHINIKPKEDWIDLFVEYGFQCAVPQIPYEPWSWWDDRTLVFRRSENCE